MKRAIHITDGAVREVVTLEQGAFLSRDVTEDGDPILRRQIDAVVERDCARRLLLHPLLRAISDSDRGALVEFVRGWEEEGLREAALEMLGVAASRPKGRHMTRQQWEALIEVVIDGDPWEISYPMSGGGECRVIGPLGERLYIKKGGRVVKP